MKYIKISIVILLVSFISIFAYKLTTNNSNNKLSLTKEQMKEMLSYTIDGNSTSSMPTKGSGYKVKSITCKSGSILSWDNDNWLLEVEKLESEDLCNIDFTTGTGSYTVTAVPNIAGSLDSTSKTTTENGQVTFYTDAIIDSVSGCTNEISDGKVIVKNVIGNTTCNINVSLTLAMQIKEKSKTNEDGVYNESGYRYEGKEPNNYIQMQKSDGTTEMWRIIGLFPDGVNGEDIIRVKKVGYEKNAYDTNKTNHWPNTTLYSSLKDTYSLANYKNTVNYKLYLGGANDTTSYKSSDFFDMERMKNEKGSAGSTAKLNYNSTTTFLASVGLIYSSDYAYGVLSSDCARTIEPYNYNGTESCYSNNWLYQNEKEIQWLISPREISDSNGSYEFSVVTFGFIAGALSYSNVSASGLYSPVMALSSDVYVTGSGTQSDPYIMK